MCHKSMNILSKILNFVKPGSEISDSPKGASLKRSLIRKFYYLVKLRQKDIFMVFCMLLIAVIGYKLGKINSLKQTPITITGGEADVYSAVSDKKPTTLKNTQAQ